MMMFAGPQLPRPAITPPPRQQTPFFFFFITLGLELSDTKVYEPYIRVLLGTTRQPPIVRGREARMGRTEGAGFRVQGLGCRVQGAGFRVQGSGCRVQGAGFRVQGGGLWMERTTAPPACHPRLRCGTHTHSLALSPSKPSKPSVG